ncbi:MAG: DNA-binding response regulator [Bacteroides sp.]|nr:DNA-binding response regulator [Bacteroides sp.]
MERVFNELTPECEITARMYAQGYEKKEIANLKCRAVSTINNQLQKAFDVLQVRNGRELATMLYERLTGMKFTMDFSPIARSVVACCLLCVFSLSLYHEQGEMRRSRRIRVERVERYRRYDGNT